MKWRGWPFAAFVCTTIYGQMVSVYQYPKPVLVILGGSTLAAIAVGFVYGRNKRVWCRYLCPVNGVFGLLAKLAPVHYAVDRTPGTTGAAPARDRRRALDCAPLVPVRTMRGASACHMCGRCAGFKDAVALATRPASRRSSSRRPGGEAVGDGADRFGLLGVAPGAFLWSSSPWFVAVKQQLAEWLVAHDIVWLLEPSLPWWILTNYPAHNDVLSPLDGGLLIAYILATAAVLGGRVFAASRSPRGRWAAFEGRAAPPSGAEPHPDRRLRRVPRPVRDDVTQLNADGLSLAFVAAAAGRPACGASLWSVSLAWSRYRPSMRVRPGPGRGDGRRSARRRAQRFNWVLMFWIW